MKKHMTQKDLKQTESLENAYDLWKKNKLPSDHKIMCFMRRKHAHDDEYKNAKTLPQKKAFQEKFMQTELSGMVEKYEYNEEVIEEQKEEGELYSFDRIVTFEGGAQNPANITAAKEICRECLKRGPPYAKRSGWSKRVKYMYVVEGFSNRKKNSWKITKTGEAEKQRSPTPKRDDGTTPVVPKEKKAAKAKSAIEKALTSANGMKKLYADTDQQTTELLQSMSQDPQYSSEKLGYEKVVLGLQDAVRQAKQKDAFYSTFLLRKWAHVKEDYDLDSLPGKLKSMVDDLEVPVQKLSRKVNEILSVVQARLKATRVKKAKK